MMLEMTMDGVFHYQGIGNNDAKCRLRIYERSGQMTVVVATELPSNCGTSIICMSRQLAEEVWKYLERPSHRYIWIEHVPDESQAGGDDQQEAFSFVEFGSSASEFGMPRWTSVCKIKVEELLGVRLIDAPGWEQHLLSLPVYALPSTAHIRAQS